MGPRYWRRGPRRPAPPTACRRRSPSRPTPGGGWRAVWPDSRPEPAGLFAASPTGLPLRGEAAAAALMGDLEMAEHLFGVSQALRLGHGSLLLPACQGGGFGDLGDAVELGVGLRRRRRARLLIRVGSACPLQVLGGEGG